jgi:Cft2 family RNA processing exonuclease
MSDIMSLKSMHENREHPTTNMRSELADLITQSVQRGGVVVVLAVEGMQKFMFILKHMMELRQIPRVPVFDDSPMAVRAMDTFLKSREEITEEARALVDRYGSPMTWPGFTFATTSEQSREINDSRYPCIIVSSSGAVKGGRIQHHLMLRLPDPRNQLLLIGPQPPGTQGMIIKNGAPEIRILGHFTPIRAQVAALDQFSDVTNTPEADLVQETSRIISPDQFRGGHVTLVTDGRLIRYIDEHPTQIYGLGPRQFEELVADLLTQFGYDTVKLGPHGRDGGVDVFAERDAAGGRELTLVQCKRYSRSNKVGEPIVKQLHTDVNDRCASRGLVVTTSFFSKDALSYIAERQYRLAGVDYEKLQTWIRKMRGNFP